MNVKNNSIKQFKGRAIDKNRRTIELIVSQIAYSTDNEISVRSLKMFLLIIHSEILYQIMNCNKKKIEQHILPLHAKNLQNSVFQWKNRKSIYVSATNRKETTKPI